MVKSFLRKILHIRTIIKTNIPGLNKRIAVAFAKNVLLLGKNRSSLDRIMRHQIPKKKQLPKGVDYRAAKSLKGGGRGNSK